MLATLGVANVGCTGFPPSRERRGGGAASTGGGAGVGVVGDLGWYASVGSAGFPPSRERRGGGAGSTGGGAGVGVVGDLGGCQYWLRWVPAFAGTTGGARERQEGRGGTSGGGAGTTGGGAGTTGGVRVGVVGDLGGCQCWLHWVPAFAGTTGGSAGTTGGSAGAAGGRSGWGLLEILEGACVGCTGFPPSRERRERDRERRVGDRERREGVRERQKGRGHEQSRSPSRHGGQAPLPSPIKGEGAVQRFCGGLPARKRRISDRIPENLWDAVLAGQVSFDCRQ